MVIAQHPEKYPLFPVIILVLCLVLWTAGTFWYITFAVNQSQHKWCATFQLLNEAPAPKASPGNPSRIYSAKLAADFRELQSQFGC